jgi:hypothetical protein
MAPSARAIRLSAVSGGRFSSAMPIENVTLPGQERSVASARIRWMRSASTSAPARAVSGASTTNSSPP